MKKKKINKRPPKPPIGDHPKCEDLAVAHKNWLVAYKNQTTGGLFQEQGLNTSEFWRRIHCM